MIRIFLLLFCLALHVWALRIGTYNVENLFDDSNDGSEYKEYIVGNKYGWDKKMAQKKLQNTAYAISKMDVDILGVQEVENEALLVQLAKKSGFKYHAFVKSKNAPSGVGLLSNYPIIFSKPIKAPHERIRPSLHVKLDIDGDILEIIVVHWPSLNNPRHFKEVAAMAIDKVMKNIKEGIVMGDFNDPFSIDSVASKMWAPLEEHRGWFDPWMDLYPRWSHDFFGDKKALDRMLLSEGLFDKKGLEYKCKSFKPLAQKPFIKDGIPCRWQISQRGKGRHLGKGYSDHLPLVLELSKKPFTCNEKRVQIRDLYKIKKKNVNLEIKKAVVLYSSDDGMILSDGSANIYLYKPQFSKPIGTMMDIHVSAMDDFFGVREIRALHVKKVYKQKGDLNSLMLPFSKLREAKASDVLEYVEGVVQNKRFKTRYGTIDLHVKPNFPKPKEGEVLKLERVRVGKYRGRIQLILEERQ